VSEESQIVHRVFFVKCSVILWLVVHAEPAVGSRDLPSLLARHNSARKGVAHSVPVFGTTTTMAAAAATTAVCHICRSSGLLLYRLKDWEEGVGRSENVI
jgi:hypothetical protein